MIGDGFEPTTEHNVLLRIRSAPLYPVVISDQKKNRTRDVESLLVTTWISELCFCPAIDEIQRHLFDINTNNIDQSSSGSENKMGSVSLAEPIT